MAGSLWASEAGCLIGRARLLLETGTSQVLSVNPVVSRWQVFRR